MEIYNKMGTRICKIFEEMSEIIEPKVDNHKDFSFIWFQSTKMKLRPYFTMELVQKRPCRYLQMYQATTLTITFISFTG